MADAMSAFSKAWREFKDEYPAAYAIGAVAPVTGQLAAVADYVDAQERGDSVDGAIAAASFIPGFKLAKYGSKLAPPSLRLKSQMNPVEKAIAPATRNSHVIGATADAEQIGETTAKEFSKARESELADEKREREYAAAWMDAG